MVFIKRVCDSNRKIWARAQSGVYDSTGIKLWGSNPVIIYLGIFFLNPSMRTIVKGRH